MSIIFSTLKFHRLRYKGMISVFLLLALVVSATTVGMTVLSGDMANAAVSLNQSELVRFLIIVTIIFLIRAVSSALSAYMLGRFAAGAGYKFRDNFARHFLQKPFAAIAGKSSGESLSALTNDLPGAIELVSGGGLRMVGDVIAFVVMFAYMVYVNWWLALIFFALFPLLIIMQVFIAKPLQKKSEIHLDALAKLTAVINDSFQNTSTVAAYSLENVMVSRAQTSFMAVITAVKNYVLALLPLILGGIFASMLPTFVISAVMAHQVIGGYMSFAAFIVFFGLAGEAGGWLQMLSQTLNQVQTSAAGANRLTEQMSGETENLTAGTEIKPIGDIAINAENVRFSYRGDDDVSPAVNDISFQIKKGSKVAFVGGSGSGKSTVVKLLIGLYAPNSGKISVYGNDLAEVSLQSLRNNFAYVPQDSFLFPETIAQNITGLEQVTDMERLEKSCRDAGIHDFITSLPDGYNSTLNEAAENVSGGQKQRIALARAFYKNSPIILFDEATSALDPATEAEILETFNTLAKDKTVIMVAHRIKAISFCDIIAVMDGGKLASKGTHDELYRDCSIYKNLYDAQMKEVS